MSDQPSRERAHVLVDELCSVLDVEPIDTDLFLGSRRPGAEGRVFGGMVVAQALMAAQRSVEAPFVAHSLHANFLRGGREIVPIVFRVVRDFDGRSFVNRRVVASQRGNTILILTASFQLPEQGLAHGTPMPDLPSPESLRDLAARGADFGDAIPASARAMLRRPSAFEIRPIGAPSFLNRGAGSPDAALWFRLRTPPPTGVTLRRGLLAYFSDYSLLSSAVIPHDVNLFDHAMQTASLDHAIWFHADPPLEDWLLYVTHSPWSGHGRGFARGTIFARDGRLVAHTAQEGLIRMRPDQPTGLTVPHVP